MSDQKKTAIKKLCSRIVLMIGLSGIFSVHAGNLPDAQELM
ncbi:hypothetical protein [Methylobacter sp.]|nr:hypothetical protein [Methylobacter sp.]